MELTILLWTLYNINTVSLEANSSGRCNRWKEHINRQIAKERTTTGSGNGCPPKADAGYFPAAVVRKENTWHPKLATTNKLPRNLTLKSRREIELLLKNGRRKSGSFGTMVWEGSESFRYAILVSGKIKKAVVRNRLKRLFREAIRLHRQTLSVPVQVVFIVRQISNEPVFADIDREIAGAFQFISSQKD